MPYFPSTYYGRSGMDSESDDDLAPVATHREADPSPSKDRSSQPEVKPGAYFLLIPAAVLISIIESLDLKALVPLVDLVIFGDPALKAWWNTEIRERLSCPGLNNKRYSEAELKWLIKQKIAFRNFTNTDGICESGDSQLHSACNAHSCRKWLVQACLDFNDDNNINARGWFGATPLHRAACRGHIQTVALLLENGADVNLTNSMGETPIVEAAGSDRVELVAFLVAYNGSEDGSGGCVPASLAKAFSKAAIDGHIQILQVMMEHCGPAVLLVPDDESGETPLHQAVRGFNYMCNDAEVVKFLLDSGAEVDAVMELGMTPLCLASAETEPSAGLVECIQMLVDAGADVNFLWPFFGTPLELANISLESALKKVNEGDVNSSSDGDNDDSSAEQNNHQAVVHVQMIIDILKAAGGIRLKGIIPGFSF